MSNGLGMSGVPFDNVSMVETVERIDEFIRQGGTHQVATANIDYLLNANRDLEYRRILCMCDLVVPDGMPIVWASRLFGSPLRERVTGVDLVPRLAQLSSEKGYGLFLLGASPQISEAAERRLKELSPGVRITGRLSPPVRPLEEFDNVAIMEAIDRAKPEILLVAFGSPKQEKWISRNRHLLNVPVAIGVGGSLDFLAGSIKRAPEWMRTSGLEWVYRMYQEPRRLGPRYMGDGLWIVRYLTAQLVTNMAGIREHRDLALSLDSIGAIHIVRISGVMSGCQLEKLGQLLTTDAVTGPVILDLSETAHIGADGLWTLAELLRKASHRGCELWLAGMSSWLQHTLRVACFEGLIRSAASTLDAVRQISRGRLQISLELGDSWATCRISGDIPRGARATLEQICASVRLAHEHVEFDASGMADFDPDELTPSFRASGRM